MKNELDQIKMALKIIKNKGCTFLLHPRFLLYYPRSGVPTALLLHQDVVSPFADPQTLLESKNEYAQQDLVSHIKSVERECGWGGGGVCNFIFGAERGT